VHLAPRRVEVAVKPLRLPPDEGEAGAVVPQVKNGAVADEGAESDVESAEGLHGMEGAEAVAGDPC